MILYPSIDIRAGKSVRIIQGNLDDVVPLNKDPLTLAHYYKEQGFEWIHVIDLDGAIKGKPVNIEIISQMIKEVDVAFQVGGGVRTLAHVDKWFKAGAAQVLMGTAALENPDVLRAACEKYPGRLVVSLDAKGGFITTAGWQAHSNVKLLDLALRVEKMGVAAIVYTDVDRDGTQLGINVDVAVDLAWSLTIPVIVNGGVASIEDLTAIRSEAASGLAGVIVGTSLHDGRIDPQSALRLFKSTQDQT